MFFLREKSRAKEMAGHVSGGYFPLYPHRDTLDPDIRTFITNFYRASDMPNSNELWISYFTKDADVTMGNEVGQGVQGMSLIPFSWIHSLQSSLWERLPKRDVTDIGLKKSEPSAPECGTASNLANTASQRSSQLASKSSHPLQGTIILSMGRSRPSTS